MLSNFLNLDIYCYFIFKYILILLLLLLFSVIYFLNFTLNVTVDSYFEIFVNWKIHVMVSYKIKDQLTIS